ncbi:MAG: hypothetical protein MUF54_18420 [Polyangiaceae bacterium]|jgi:hypothetical protein|nr:hypothetical protein [Polyangiaceae bacterium]
MDRARAILEPSVPSMRGAQPRSMFFLLADRTCSALREAGVPRSHRTLSANGPSSSGTVGGVGDIARMTYGVTVDIGLQPSSPVIELARRHGCDGEDGGLGGQT